MSENKDLERELCREFGDDVTDLLDRDMRKYRLNCVWWWIKYVLISFAILCGVFYLYYRGKVNDEKFKKYPSIKASIVEISTDRGSEKNRRGLVKYKFNIDGSHYTGGVGMSVHDANAYKDRDSVFVRYCPDDPSVNRGASVKETSRFWGGIFLGFFVLFVIITWSNVERGPLVCGVVLKDDLFWLGYIRQMSYVSPRGWYRGPPKIKNGKKIWNRRCSGYYPLYQMLNREFEYIKRWMSKHQGQFDLPQYLSAKYNLCRYFYKLTNDPEFSQMNSSESLGPRNRLISKDSPRKKIADLIDGCVKEKTFYEILELDLQGFHEQAYHVKMIEKAKNTGFLEKVLFRRIRALFKRFGSSEENIVYSFRKLSLSGEVYKEESLNEEKAFKLKSELLYMFFENPWSLESCKKTLKYIDGSDQVSVLCLEYEPDGFVRVSFVPEKSVKRKAVGKTKKPDKGLKSRGSSIAKNSQRGAKETGKGIDNEYHGDCEADHQPWYKPGNLVSKRVEYILWVVVAWIFVCVCIAGMVYGEFKIVGYSQIVDDDKLNWVVNLCAAPMMIGVIAWAIWVFVRLKVKEPAMLLIPFLIALVMVGLCGMKVPGVFNKAWDTSAGKEYYQEIVHKAIHDNSNVLICEPPRSLKSKMKVRVRKSIYNKADKEKHRVHIVMYSGYFDAKWFDVKGIVEKDELDE